MTQEQIKIIASKYVEDVIEHLPIGPRQYVSESTKNMLKMDCKSILIYLSKHYLIADKEKAISFYNGDTFGELDFIELCSTRRVLESLFGKETFINTVQNDE